MSIVRKKRQVVTDYRIRVAAEQRQDHPQIYTRIVVQHILSGQISTRQRWPLGGNVGL